MVIFFGDVFWDDGNYVVKCGLSLIDLCVVGHVCVNHCGWREVFKMRMQHTLKNKEKREEKSAPRQHTPSRSLCCLCICTPLQVRRRGAHFKVWLCRVVCWLWLLHEVWLPLYVLAAAMRIFSTEALSISSSLLAWMTFWTPLKAFFRLSKEAE